MNVFATTAAVILASTIGATAMTSDALIKGEVAALGYNAETVESLTDAQIQKLSHALYNGDDSDVRSAVRSIVNG